MKLILGLLLSTVAWGEGPPTLDQAKAEFNKAVQSPYLPPEYKVVPESVRIEHSTVTSNGQSFNRNETSFTARNTQTGTESTFYFSSFKLPSGEIVNLPPKVITTVQVDMERTVVVKEVDDPKVAQIVKAIGEQENETLQPEHTDASKADFPVILQTSRPAPDLGAPYVIDQYQGMVRNYENETQMWANQRSQEIKRELAQRDANIRSFVDQNLQIAAAMTANDPIEARRVGLQLASELSALHSDLAKKVARLGGFDRFSDPMAETRLSATYSAEDFSRQLRDVDDLVKNGAYLQAALFLNNLNDGGVGVRGASKNQLLSKYLDSKGLAKFGAQTHVFGDGFEGPTPDIGRRLNAIGNIYQAAILQRKGDLEQDDNLRNIYFAGALGLRYAEKQFSQNAPGVGESALRAAKFLGLVAAGAITGVGWSLGEVFKNVSVFSGLAKFGDNINTAMGDPNFTKNLLLKAIDYKLDELKPGLSKLIHERGEEITRRSTFQVGLMAGKAITDAAILYLTYRNPKLFLFTAGAIIPGDIGEIRSIIKNPNIILDPLIRSAQQEPMAEILGNDSAIGKWFREELFRRNP